MKLYFYPVAAIFAALICTESFAQSCFPTDGGNVSIGAGPCPTPGTDAINIIRNNADGGASNSPAISLKNTNPNDPAGSGYNLAWASFWAGNGQVIGQIAAGYGTGGGAPWNSGTGLYIHTRSNHPIFFGTASSEKMRITNDGKVGIGVTSPLDKLHVANGNIRLSGGYETFFEDNGQIRSFDDNHRILFRRSENIMEFREYGSIIFSPGTTSASSTSQVVMLANGNVGIGTTNPQGKLAVKGDLYAMKVKVTQTGWGDYVFENNYKLRPLSELEEYVHKYHHLPEIPAATEIEKNGLDLGDNQAKSVVKIEELTLYLIQQSKIIEQLNSKVADLEKELHDLKKGR